MCARAWPCAAARAGTMSNTMAASREPGCSACRHFARASRRGAHSPVAVQSAWPARAPRRAAPASAAARAPAAPSARRSKGTPAAAPRSLARTHRRQQREQAPGGRAGMPSGPRGSSRICAARARWPAACASAGTVLRRGPSQAAPACSPRPPRAGGTRAGQAARARLRPLPPPPPLPPASPCS